jgi:hypothetical protein
LGRASCSPIRHGTEAAHWPCEGCKTARWPARSKQPLLDANELFRRAVRRRGLLRCARLLSSAMALRDLSLVHGRASLGTLATNRRASRWPTSHPIRF